MHARIEYVSDREVAVIDRYGKRHTFEIDGHGELTIQTDGVAYLNGASSEAVGLIRNCHAQTGSFAALLDTSAVPFVGKEVRCGELLIVGGATGWITSRSGFAGREDCWFLQLPSGRQMAVKDTELLPLTPAPHAEKWRAFRDGIEAAAAFYQTSGPTNISDKRGGRWRIKSIDRFGANLEPEDTDPVYGVYASWKNLRVNYTLDGNPVGVRESVAGE